MKRIINKIKGGFLEANLSQGVGVLISSSVVVLIWLLILWWGDFPEFILPAPGSVAIRFVKEVINGQLIYHSLITMTEVLLGLLLGSISAVMLGYVIFKSKFLDRLLSPILIASQAIPVVAIAPLIVLWFGSGIWSKVLVCGIIVFFPILINTIIGLRAIPKEFSYLLATLHAKPIQIFQYLEIPASLTIFLAGMRIGATLSVTGAIVGEFLGADRGLGFLINVARGQYDTAMVFVVIIVLVILAVTLYVIFVGIENQLLKWNLNRN